MTKKYSKLPYFTKICTLMQIVPLVNFVQMCKVYYDFAPWQLPPPPPSPPPSPSHTHTHTPTTAPTAAAIDKKYVQL